MNLLEREYDRLAGLIVRYRKAINALPRGSISEKTLRARRYAYLARRDGGKVRFTYIGPADSAKPVSIRNRIAARRVFEALLRAARKSHEEIQKGIIRAAPKIAARREPIDLLNRNFRHVRLVWHLKRVNGSS